MHNWFIYFVDNTSEILRGAEENSHEAISKSDINPRDLQREYAGMMGSSSANLVQTLRKTERANNIHSESVENLQKIDKHPRIFFESP